MYYTAIYMLGFGFSLGVQVFIARRNGEVRYQDVGKVFYQATMRYIEWRDYSYLFAFPLLAIRAFFIGTTNTKILTANSLVIVVCNIGFNYLLIFGKWGFPKLGISGAAIGSFLAGLIGLLFMILYMWKHENSIYIPDDKYNRLFDLPVYTVPFSGYSTCGILDC
ncbi:MAG: polysaccharide biosynthesis C-terminal domain-containing protein [Bacteroidales bacterium]|jgi:Na+-driven multidrug efflux pump